MKILVTGADGFIGRNCCDTLREAGHTVIGSDVTMGNPVQSLTTLEGYDAVVHLGGSSSNVDFTDALSATENNCGATAYLIESARKAGVKHFVFISTASLYDCRILPHIEKDELKINNLYAATKLFGEKCCEYASEQYGMKTTVLRLASVYGFDERSKGRKANVISQFIWDIMNDRPPEIWGDGNQTRDFIHVSDVCNAIQLMLEHPFPICNTICNVGTGIETSFMQICNLIYAKLGKTIPPKFILPTNDAVQSKQILRQCMDTNKLRNIYHGWKPEVSVLSGVWDTCDRYAEAT